MREISDIDPTKRTEETHRAAEEAIDRSRNLRQLSALRRVLRELTRRRSEDPGTPPPISH